ncbi:hypothetical protein [Paenibacillus tyrfis]|uniref:hypothetical protein n=1 Tax=Paenibacillus tyrfis TaxID=1501230 RepID=UPI00068A2C05|nr:hypothetical protein [Paenibacillus tyrfis]
MDYFLISQDTRIQSAVPIVPSSAKVFGGNPNQDPPILYVRHHENNEYPDYLERPLQLVSNGFKRILKKYVPALALHMAILIDKQNGQQQVYWHPELDVIDCKSAHSEHDPLGLVTRLILDESRIGDQVMFHVPSVLQPYTVIRLDLAESLLRRDLYGFQLTKAETVKGDEEHGGYTRYR